MEGGAEAEALAKQSYRESRTTEKKNQIEEFLQWQKDHRRKMLGDEENTSNNNNTNGGDGSTPYISNMSEEEMAEKEQISARGAQQTKTWAGKMLYGGVSYAVPLGERIEEEDVICPITNMDGSDLADPLPVPPITNAEVNEAGTDSEKERNATPTHEKLSPPAPPTKEELQSAGCYITPASELMQDQALAQKEEAAKDKNPVATTIRARPSRPRIPDALSIIEKQISDMDLDNEVEDTMVPSRQESRVVEVPKSLYWSEKMDMDLAGHVRSLGSNFVVIADKIKKGAEEKIYGDLAALSVDLVTSDECRSRWNFLDAGQWCELAPDTSSIDAVHRIFINPNIIGDRGQGHGAQPSYDQLRTISAGSAPSYLKTPSLLPSTSEQKEEEDEVLEPIKIPSLKEAISQLVSLD